MARADTPTLLPLDTYAKTMLLNPAHFNGAHAPNANASLGGMMPIPEGCGYVWRQHSWQENDAASRETIAERIAEAEEEMMDLLGYPVAPRWFSEERHLFDNLYDSHGQHASMKTNYVKVIEGGRRTVTLVGTATVAGAELVYSDSSGGSYGFNDLATITLPTTLTDAREIKVYFAGHDGDETWEIRPCRRKYLSGGNVVIEFEAWQLIIPSIWETLPDGDGVSAIDISTDANYVTSVEVYREYSDPAQAAVEFFWRDPCSVCGGSGCAQCSTTMQTGCLTVLDPDQGRIVPYPADYDSDTGAWKSVGWTINRCPDFVKLYYRAGDRTERYLTSKSYEPIDTRLIKAISYMATARLAGGLGACPRVSNLVDWLQEDVSRLSQGASFFTPQELLLNPFGPRRGEVIAYRACRAPKMRGVRAAVI